MKNIIFIAPPAAGKGTISDYLVKNYQYEHISTGDLLREEIASGSEFGQKLDVILKSGSLVDDETVIRLVNHKITSLSHQAFILDGFPRTLGQAKVLDEMFRELNIHNNVVIYLSVGLGTVLKRVTARVICPKCKRSYNLNNEKLKPIHKDTCDDCGYALIRRDDDNEETHVYVDRNDDLELNPNDEEENIVPEENTEPEDIPEENTEEVPTNEIEEEPIANEINTGVENTENENNVVNEESPPINESIQDEPSVAPEPSNTIEEEETSGLPTTNSVM